MLVWGDRVLPPWRVRLLGCCYGAYYTACIWLLRPVVGGSPACLAGPRVLYYAPHSDLVPGVFTQRSLRGVFWVNDNTLGGYAGAMPALLAGIGVFRIGRGGARTPYEQVRDFLQRHPGPVGIFTDGGRRDGRVRKSLVGLAHESGRPLVPVRVRASRAWHMHGQWIPLPFSRIAVARGMPIEAARLMRDGASPEQVRDHLQEALDAL